MLYFCSVMCENLLIERMSSLVKRLLTGFLLLVIGQGWLYAGTGYFFYVQFSDKHHSPYSIEHPEAYLSARSIERRSLIGAAIDSTDLPVNPHYLQAITAMNIRVYNLSKWMNGVTVFLTDSNLMSGVRALPYVKFVQYTGKRTSTASSVRARSKFASESYSYGNAAAQINQVNGQFLHQKGYTGKNIYIGILDAGFYNANNNAAFDSLRIQGRLLGVKNIAEPETDVYSLDQHGANVLSIMTGNLPGQYLGAAPHASFLLVRTEYVANEYLSEADFWCSGLEYADSVGVDIINSSLGYTTFDDSRMNFSYADMTGRVCRASRSAAMAARKGIIVCNSAGNDGNKTWHYLGAPADADSILTVGAVTSLGVVSEFSSFGPCSDGRVKPDICAQGTSTAFVSYSGLPLSGNGTSYSSPVVAGLTACLLQAFRQENLPSDPVSVRNAIVRSGSLYATPTSQMGYGIANYEYAYNYSHLAGLVECDARPLNVSVNVQNKTLHISLVDNEKVSGTTLAIFDVRGVCCYLSALECPDITVDTSRLPAGVYVVRLSSATTRINQKIILQ